MRLIVIAIILAALIGQQRPRIISQVVTDLGGQRVRVAWVVDRLGGAGPVVTGGTLRRAYPRSDGAWDVIADLDTCASRLALGELAYARACVYLPVVVR